MENKWKVTIGIIVLLPLAFGYWPLSVAIVLVLVLYYVLRWLLTEMARRNILVTFRTEAELKAIMKGEKCVRWVMAVANHLVDPDDFDIYKASLKNLRGLIEQLVDRANKKQIPPTAEKPNKAYDPSFKERKLIVGENTVEKQTELDKAGIEWMVKKNHKGEEKLFWLNPEFKKRLADENSETLFEKLFGVVWVGFLPFYVFGYIFRWLKYGQEKTADRKPSDEIKMHPRDEEVFSLFFRYTQYGMSMDSVETGAGSFGKKGAPEPERIQLGLEFVFETITRNPQKTLFRTAGKSAAGEWQNAISTLLRDAVRKWVGQVDYDYIIANKKGVEKDLREIVNLVNSGTVDTVGIEGRPAGNVVSAIHDYGQEIVKINLVSVELKDARLQSAVKLVFLAEQQRRAAEKQALRDEALARGRKALEAAPYLGLHQGLEIIAKIPGGQGTRMFIAKQLGAGGIKVLQVGSGGSGPILNLPESVLGETPEDARTTKPEEAPGDELVREMAKELATTDTENL